VTTPARRSGAAPRHLGGTGSRFARLAGVEVHHRVEGPADAPAVVLLHHFHGSVATWRHVMTDLGADHRVAAFDRPGFGLSARPHRSSWNGANPYTRASAVAITLELADLLGAEQAVLVGASAGGTVALETYARAPDRVRALVLLSPAITGDVGPPAALRPLLRARPARRVGPALVRTIRRSRTIDASRVGRAWHDATRVEADDVAAYTRPLAAPGWDRAFWEVVTAEPPPDLRRLLPRVAVPTLLLAGASDRVVPPAWSRRTAAAIPGAHLEILPGCGHTPHEERPDLVTEVIRRFLAQR
jgi:pimeloyl-ACP methyl ester carboxylesterase